jgi:hypothetical protein
MCRENNPMTHIATRIAAAEYAAIVKPTATGTRSRSQPGVVVLIIKAVQAQEADRTFSFPSWDFLRERLLVFGLASAKELNIADARLPTGKHPYMFSSRRWETPLIDALNLNCAQTE